jgi:alcohol dehydrogenase class IV
MRFEFATATKILFGAGLRREAAKLAAGLGRRALLVTGLPVEAEAFAALRQDLEQARLSCSLLAVADEPTVDFVRQAVTQARQQDCDMVLGVGGGSALDTGKAVAALLTNPGDVYDYLEVIGRGQPLACPSAPYLAIPTTAGTGAEVTRNAVLNVPEQRVKVSLRSPHMLPRVALVDPELTYSLPPAQTASTGLDALTQLIEPYVSLKANPLVDALCREGLRRAAGALRRAYANGRDVAAREDMALASLLGGLALANAGLGAVHGFAGPLGGMFPAPHGAVCARLLPLVVEANLRALQARQPESPVLARYAELACLLTDQANAAAADGVAWLQALVESLAIPRLGAYGLTAADIPQVVAKSAQASSMQGNPIALTPTELQAIVAAAL